LRRKCEEKKEYKERLLMALSVRKCGVERPSSECRDCLYLLPGRPWEMDVESTCSLLFFIAV